MVVVGEREDAFAGVGGADAEVVHAAGAAEAHLAFGVEPVVAQAVVAWAVPVAGWGGFGGGAVGVAWGVGGQARGAGAARCSARGTRRAGVAARRCVRAGGRALSQRCRVWWNRSVLPWVWGCPGDPFFWRTPSSGRTYSNALRPPVNREV